VIGEGVGTRGVAGAGGATWLTVYDATPGTSAPGCQRSPYSEPPGSGKLSHPGSPILSQAGSPMLSHPGAGMLSHPAGGDRTSWC
jgi:hypothetical protein